MKKIIILSISIVVFLSGCSGCVYGVLHPVRKDGPYKGKIVDADTGQPVEGVVVLGTWSKVYPNVAGATHKYYDAKEAVTDKNGDFLIPGLGLLLFSNVEPMNFIIFKTGYEYIGMDSWTSLKVDSILIQKVKWAKDVVIIPLKNLTTDERKKQGPPSRPSIGVEKMRLLTNEINKERIAIGLTPFEL